VGGVERVFTWRLMAGPLTVTADRVHPIGQRVAIDEFRRAQLRWRPMPQLGLFG
jgi:hypothetical protein